MNNMFFANPSNVVKATSKDSIKFTPTCLDPDESRTFYQGKSFRCWEWSENKDRTYLNDEFYQDFAMYNGSLYVCINTTTEIPGLSKDWKLVIEQLEGRVFLPTVDLDGNLTWDLLRGDFTVQTVNVKGPKGEKGEKGDTGPQGEPGPQGIRGEKGESGNGNFEVGSSKPNNFGSVNDVYLDISTGIFYKYNDDWTEIGRISIDSPDIDLKNYYTKKEIDSKIESIDFPEFNLDWQDD